MKKYTLIILLFPLAMACSSKKEKADKFVKAAIEKSDSLHDYKTALMFLEKALEIDETNAMAYYQRGKIRAQKNLFDEALNDLDLSIQLDSTYPLAFNDRALVKTQLGFLDEAVRDFNKAVSLDPKYAAAYSNRGLNSIYRGKYKEALADISKSVELDPKKAYGYYNRGLNNLILHNFADAVKDFNKCIELDPNSQQAKNELSEAEAKLNHRKDTVNDDTEVSLLQYRTHLVFMKAKDLLKKKELKKGVSVINEYIANVDTLLKKMTVDKNEKNSVRKDTTDKDFIKLSRLYFDLSEVYFLRGSIKQQLKLNAEACDDWKIAAGYGNNEAKDELLKSCK